MYVPFFLLVFGSNILMIIAVCRYRFLQKWALHKQLFTELNHQVLQKFYINNRKYGGK